jgi:hypothetical protein
MTVRIRARTDRDGVGQWFWATKEAPEHDARRAAYFDLTATKGRWRDYSVTFNVDGRLASVRLDPGDSPGPVEIESIQISRADRPSADWAQVDLAFEVDRSSEVRFDVKDEDGRPTTAAFRIEDEAGRVYPSQGKRLAPDFFFQAQVYRADGESIRLPPGTFTVVASRGPESVPEERTVRIADGVEPAPIAYRVRRWVDPSKLGWWSGDHHIHAAGCRHYSEPTEGVMPADMFRHCLGEDLKVGCCLTWGPCFDFQKQFFTGGVDKVSSSPYLLRYDIEVSGFGSHQSGHLCLLGSRTRCTPAASRPATGRRSA